MQEQVNERSVALTFRATKLTDRALAKAMAAALRQMKKSYRKPKKGRQSYRRMTRIGAKTDEMEIGAGYTRLSDAPGNIRWDINCAKTETWTRCDGRCSSIPIRRRAQSNVPRIYRHDAARKE